MQNKIKVGELIFTGITVNDLLLQIEQLLDAKVSSQPVNDFKQSDYLSRKQVSNLLKISLPTLHEYSKLGWVKSYKIGSRVLYKQSEVITCIEKVNNIKFKKGVSHAA